MWNDRRRMVLGLAGSLLLNMFLLGLVLGRGTTWHAHQTPPPGLPPIAARQYVNALPADQKQIFKDAEAAHQKSIREARRRHRDLRAKVEADIAAATLNRPQLDADLAALHQSNRDIEDATTAVLLDALPSLTPIARATLVGQEPSKP